MARFGPDDFLQCNFCGRLLNQETWYDYYRRVNRYVCKECDKKRKRGTPRAELYIAHEKLCRRCGQGLTPDTWPPSRERKDHRLCTPCHSVDGKARYQRNAARVLDRQKERRRALRQEVVAAYGGCCVCCGEDRWEFLTIDHINGDGKQHRRQLASQGTDIYPWLKRNGYPKEGFRLLCFNCNCSIGFLGYCPHQLQDGGLA